MNLSLSHLADPDRCTLTVCGLGRHAKGEVDKVDDLDGPVAAPDHHTVVFGNDYVRVLETVIPVGDTAPLHSHLAKHLMIVESGSHFVRRGAVGEILLDTRAAGAPFVLPEMMWSDGVPAHTLEHTGDDDIWVTAIELKS